MFYQEAAYESTSGSESWCLSGISLNKEDVKEAFVVIVISVFTE